MYVEQAHQQVVHNFEHTVVVLEQDSDTVVEQVHRMEPSLIVNIMVMPIGKNHCQTY